MKQAPATHTHGSRHSRQLTRGSWPDFEKLFASNRGVWGGCWCMFYHEPGGFDPGAYERNKKAKQVLVERRKAHGTLVYCSEEPVGWCQFGPKEELTRVDRKKGYSQTSPRPWRVTCFFIAPGHRRQGMAEFALRETIRALKKLGVKDVEAYPVEGKVTASSLWSGTPGLFEAEGFQRVAPLGKKSWVYSLRLDHQ